MFYLLNSVSDKRNNSTLTAVQFCPLSFTYVNTFIIVISHGGLGLERDKEEHSSRNFLFYSLLWFQRQIEKKLNLQGIQDFTSSSLKPPTTDVKQGKGGVKEREGEDHSFILFFPCA